MWAPCVCDYVGFVRTPHLLVLFHLLSVDVFSLYKTIDSVLLLIESAASALFMRFVSCYDEHIEP